MKNKSLIILNDKGVTLIELMVVVVILGIFIGFIGPRIMGRADDARITKAKIDIKNLETALDLYKLDNGLYPGTEQGLQALIEPPEVGILPKRWKTGGYLAKGKLPKDPWKNEYLYLSPGVKGECDIISYGADGVQGGEGKNADISNWDDD